MDVQGPLMNGAIMLVDEHQSIAESGDTKTP